MVNMIIIYCIDFLIQITLKKNAFYPLIDEQGEMVKADRISCRGSLILLTVGTKVYLADLKDIITVLCKDL